MTPIDLKEKAKKLPLLPGVYLMKDALGSVIYVGKSKALKRRVSSYFGEGAKPKKVQRMVRSIYDFEIRYTDTELEALLLECRLIKQMKPLYNRLLKQDHKYRYFYLNESEKRPRLKMVREQNAEKGLYFGPYEKGQALFEAMTLLNRIFQLPDCKASEIKENCLTYKRNNCIGPCKKPYDEALLATKLQELIDFLKGEDETLISDCEAQMQAAAEALEFEKAQELKKEWELLKMLQFKKEAMQFAKTHQIILFQLDRPKGGTKLFMVYGYHILHAGQMPTSFEGYKSFIKSYEMAYQQASLKVEECIEKAHIDEIYILYSYLKTIPKEKKWQMALSNTPKKDFESIKKSISKWCAAHGMV